MVINYIFILDVQPSDNNHDTNNEEMFLSRKRKFNKNLEGLCGIKNDNF